MTTIKTIRTIELTFERREFFVLRREVISVDRCVKCGGPVFLGNPEQIPNESSVLEASGLGANEKETDLAKGEKACLESI